MGFRGIAAVGSVVLAGLIVPDALLAQSEFPLTGRWTYFDYGTRALQLGELDDACMQSWDSYAPDGGFLGFEMDDFGQVSAVYGGFCVVFGQQITCNYLLDSEIGAVDDMDEGEFSRYTDDIVDYVLYGENGKPDYDNSWTYMRCPPSAGFSVG